MNLDSIEEFSNITQKNLKVTEEEKHCDKCAKDFAEKGGCKGKYDAPKDCKKPECLKYAEKYCTEQYGLLKDVKVPPSTDEDAKDITFFPKKKRTKESCVLEFVKKGGCEGKFKLPNGCKDEETKSLVADYCSEYEGTEINKTELFSQSTSSNLAPPTQKKTRKHTHKTKEQFGDGRQICTGGGCSGGNCWHWGICDCGWNGCRHGCHRTCSPRICVPRVCVPDVGHAAWHVAEEARKEAERIALEIKRAAEALAREMKRLGEFFKGLDLLKEIKKLLPSEKDIMNALNLGAMFDKISKDLGLAKIMDSVKKPFDDVANEVKKIPESFDKIVQDIKNFDPMEMLGINNIGKAITNIFKDLMNMFKDGVISIFKFCIDAVTTILRPFTMLFVKFIKWLDLGTYFNYGSIFVNVIILMGFMSSIGSMLTTYSTFMF